jgi:hypothetical protein
MGMFDTIIVGDKDMQVKCFYCDLDVYKIGDKVPDINGDSTYFIVGREQLIAQVVNGELVSLSEYDSNIQFSTIPVYDKFGNEFFFEDKEYFFKNL